MEPVMLALVIVVVGAFLTLKSAIVALAGIFLGSILSRRRPAAVAPRRPHGRRS